MPRPDRIDACLPSALLQQVSYAIDFTWAIPTTPVRQGVSNWMTTYQNDLMWSFLNIASLKRETESWDGDGEIIKYYDIIVGRWDSADARNKMTTIYEYDSDSDSDNDSDSDSDIAIPLSMLAIYGGGGR